MAFSGKDCKLLLEKVDAIEGELSQFPKGIEACGITRAAKQVNIVIKRSQLKDDLLKQLSLWNWQHAPEPDEADRESLAVSTTPPLEELATKRARKPLRRSPQVAEWLPASGVSGVSSATGSKSASSEYVDLSGDDEEN
ncbi:hypothetical protein FOZ61_007108 [Perkinsus olseni]|uniref:Uncharacterized protein n=1 Tax=Perkinsus olseni TaxID=32597 RepID=A0A7J6M9S3_PEROL|nr:hypothetical protein FOZ61_007108 [Perkinsus olseni]